MRLFWLCSVICACFAVNDAAKILAVFSAPSKSHVILGSALLKGLAAKGHDVTMVSPFPLGTPVKNYRDIVIGDLKKVITKSLNNGFHWQKSGISILKTFHDVGLKMTETTLADINFQKLLQSDEKFDLIIVELFLNEALLALGHHYDAPVIGFSVAVPDSDLTGNPSSLAYVPQISLGFSDHMTFTERMINTFSAVMFRVYRILFYLPEQNTIKETYFPGSPHLQDIMTHIPLVLQNTHVSLGYPRPMVPALVEIGGFHVEPPKALPGDLQKYLDEATQGVVLFSFGSNLNGVDMPAEKRQAFIDAFSKMKENILWKWEDDTIPDQPKNVKISKWLPQQDILAHPNVKGFMTHGGFLSTTEAVTRGVPVVGVPIFGDQITNMKHAQTLGYGVFLEFSNVTAQSVTWALREMLDNPSYRQVAKERSMLLKDQEVPPLEKAIFWVEYVLRHNRASHLRVASLDLSFIQYFLLDVLALILVIITLFSAIVYFGCKKLFCSKKRSSRKESNGKKQKQKQQ